MSSFIGHFAVAVAGTVVFWGVLLYSAIHAAAPGIAHFLTLLN
jgi:hypothetical protein